MPKSQSVTVNEHVRPFVDEVEAAGLIRVVPVNRSQRGAIEPLALTEMSPEAREWAKTHIELTDAMETATKTISLKRPGGVRWRWQEAS